MQFHSTHQHHGYDYAPLTVAWEATRSCPLRCQHCRATAQLRRDDNELTTKEGKDLIDQASRMGTKIFVITGGDPLARPDIYSLIERASSMNLHVGFSPSVTGRLTQVALDRVAKSGAHTVHISLDGATSASHDGFRGVRGSFERTVNVLKWVSQSGLALQVGTTVTKDSIAHLPEIAELLGSLGISIWSWSLFFLIPTGRAQELEIPDAYENERVLSWLATTSFPFRTRVIEAPFFKRVIEQTSAGSSDGLAPNSADLQTMAARDPLGNSVAKQTPAVRDGDGFCFISHVGDVYPSGFLQVNAGNVREHSLAEIYQKSELFRSLRDRTLLKGKCGSCEYRTICGGSRARAWASGNDYLGEDPGCAYVPDQIGLQDNLVRN